MCSSDLSASSFAPIEAHQQTQVISRPSLSYWQDAWIRLKANKRALVSLYIVIGLLLFTIAGPLVWQVDPAIQDIEQISQPPGTDRGATIVPDYEPWFGTQGLPGSGLRLAEPANSQTVRMQWDALPGANGHRVYRNLFPVGSELAYGIPLAEFLNNDTLYFEDRLDLQPGRFYYSVVALDARGQITDQ